MWRYVDGGERYLVADWPEEDFRAFDEEGTSTIYDEIPEIRGAAGLRTARPWWLTGRGDSTALICKRYPSDDVTVRC